MKLQLPPANAAFDASARTITFSGTVPATLSHIYAIWNLTDGAPIFLPTSPGLGGTYASPVLTLDFDASAMADDDALFIIYDDALDTVAVVGPVTNAELRATAVPVAGTVTANAGTGPFPVSDNAGSLTVDAPVGTPVFVRLSDGTSAIATLPVSAASLPLPSGAATAVLQTQPGVDIGDVTINNASGGASVNIQDGGNSITVDGTVAANLAQVSVLVNSPHPTHILAIGGPNSGGNMQLVSVDGFFGTNERALTVNPAFSGTAASSNGGATDAGTQRVSANLSSGDGTAVTQTAGALDVNIKTADITIEAGTEYTEGATADADPTGSVIIGSDGTDYQAVGVNDGGVANALNVALTDGAGTRLGVNGDGMALTVALGDGAGNLLALNAGATTATTLRTSANIASEGTPITNTAGGLDVNILSSSVPFGGVQYASGVADPGPAYGNVIMGSDNANIHAIGINGSGQSLNICLNDGAGGGLAAFGAAATSALTLRTTSNISAGDGTAVTQTAGALDVNIKTVDVSVVTEYTQAATADANPIGSVIIGSDGTNYQAVGVNDGGVANALNVALTDGAGNRLSLNPGASNAQTLRVAANLSAGDGTAVGINGTGDALTVGLSVGSIIEVNLNAGTGEDITQTGGALDVNIKTVDVSVVTEYTEGTTADADPTGSVIIGSDGTDYKAVGVDGAGSALNVVGPASGLTTSPLIDSGAGLLSLGANGYIDATRGSANVYLTDTDLDKDAGVVGAQTLRTFSNIGIGGTEMGVNGAGYGLTVALGDGAGSLLTLNAGASGAQTLRTVLSNDWASTATVDITTASGNPLAMNMGASDAYTLRVSANLTDGAGTLLDMNVGASGAQTLRAYANIGIGGVELGTDGAGTGLTVVLASGGSDFNLDTIQGTAASVNAGATDAGTLRTYSNIGIGGTEMGVNGAGQGLTVALGDGAGALLALDAGISDAQTLRVAVAEPDVTMVSSAAYEASNVLKSSPGRLINISGYNSGPEQWIQLHDATSLPADTAVPVKMFKVPANANFSYDFNFKYVFATGIVIANSTTGPTLTTGAADCWFEGAVI